MSRTAPRVAALVAALLACALCAACERERVEVADSDAAGSGSEGDAESPVFPVGEGGPDVILQTCGPPPALGRCPPCPNGYVPLPDGGASCECCP